MGKVPREGADSQLPPGSFCERSPPWVVHRSYFTLGTDHAFGDWHVRRYMLVLDVRTVGSTSWHLLLGSPDCKQNRQHAEVLTEGTGMFFSKVI